MSLQENRLIVDFKKSMEVHSDFKKFYSRKQIPAFCNYNTSLSKDENLSNLCLHFLNIDASTCDAFSYRPILIEIIARLIHNPQIERLYLQLNKIDHVIEGTQVLYSSSIVNTFTNEISILVEHFLILKDFFHSLKNCINTISQSELQVLLLSFYRLISTNRDKFYRFIDPQVLHSLVANKSTSDINKYISILILSKYLFLSEEARSQMIKQHVDEANIVGDLDGDQNVDFNLLSLLEAQRLSNLSKITPSSECFIESNSTITFTESDLSPGVSIISGIMVPNLVTLESGTTKFNENESNFVEIPKSLDSIRSFAKYTKNSEPVLLVGGAGSGKTFLVDEMARRLHIEDTNSLVKIHLNQQTDSKTLIGTYTSGTKPGTFEWKNGVLTTAVREGKWVLIEDIDKAPNEVLSILMGLLEHREITLPSRGEILKAGNGFQMISTMRTNSNDKDEDIHLPDMIGLRLWNILKLKDLDDQDMKTILNKKFPLLSKYTDLFIKCYITVKSICDSRKFVSMNKGAQPRQISIKDLMKFCRRSEQIFKLQNIKTADELIHDDVFDTIFQEAIDCFTSAIVEQEPINFLVREIGSILEIPTSRIDLHLRRHVPELENFEDGLRVGRSYNKKQKIVGVHKYTNKVAVGNTTSFATTSHSARLMEKIGVGISMCEPLLLVGETGTGKTTVVQQMAKILNKKLTVINLSQQTEVGDLLGGFKPINAKTLALPLQEDFEQLFARSFSTTKNAQFLKLLSKCFNKSQWKNVVRLWKEAFKMAKNTFEKEELEVPESNENDETATTTKKKKRKLNATERTELMKEWKTINSRVFNFEKQVVDMKNSFIFKFVEGSLVNAVKKGDWLLLDEMNLAAPETLDSISDLLAEYQDQRSILLSEKGDVESIKAHPDFRLFGCMNPATDVGKKDLPQSIRSRFTEIYVSSPDQDIQDLLMIIDKYIGKYSLSDEWIGNDVAELYLTAKRLSDNNQIVDGANQKPHFSIRTLTRTLLYAREIAPIYGLRRALYEGFCMSLLTLLDANSEKILMPIIQQHTISKLKNAKSVLSQIPADPSNSDSKYIQFKHYWMQKGPGDPEPQTHYIITPFVEKNMLNLVRATSGGKFPVLIQGPTSAGKTSMINYLAKITGHKFVRINNHEHTDLQEYLGAYVSDDTGKLTFKEGILVDALRKGHWIVLDELNLAPTDVLEALNRLLDDNRELFIPETQETVRPHPDFMLFATQNPPGLYGGRKVLSKAFRNRFLELHFDDIPQDELEIILRERCQIAPTYAKKIVEVYKELSVTRQGGRLFEQKNSFATLRDLFRWAQREAVGYEQLAANGYMLLAERVRRPEEKVVVKQALEKVMRVKLNMEEYYSKLEVPELLEMKGPVIWTKAMRRLAVLVMTSMQNNEPLLLVGETGCGKTTVCQMIAKFFNKSLIVVNAHQNTETGDLLGAQRPIRNRSELQLKFVNSLRELANRLGHKIPDNLSYTEAVSFWKEFKKMHSPSDDDVKAIENTKAECDALFEWSDGPLVNAMKSGSYFLLDEISLADDSVLERLNSVLEPERSLLLAEKGSDDVFITADKGFQFLATMNPGGDYGKKELSPALRNRFTEIWVPSMEDFEDVRQIVRAKLSETVKHLADIVVNFSRWYGLKMGGGNVSSGVISLRDIIAWISFINTASENGLSDMTALLHGACMVFIDALGTHTTAYLAEDEEKLRTVKSEYVKKLSEFARHDLIQLYSLKPVVSISGSKLVCGPFSVQRKENAPAVNSFNLDAPTTASNAMRVIRALQVHKPILLEGSPGVGKTSLITALATATGNELTRINLSEQTDLIDLFGSDSPVEGGKAGEFVWRDAPFLRAMQQGEWVLLDEMNLASQSVLEGLNACLDHRGEVYIPELDKSFMSHPNFKVFAAQNPQLQGGGRKGLPKSFVNRFSVVYVDMLTEDDIKLIAHHLYPTLDAELCDKMISFMSKLEEQVVIKRQWGSYGAPWEFNLRDTLRWLSLVESPRISNEISPSDFFDLVVKQRFRTEKDKQNATTLFESIFGPLEKKDPYYSLQSNFVQCQNAIVTRNELVQYQSDTKISNLQSNVPILETIFRCIQQSYPLILVGPSGSGKSALIKFAADIVGSKVYEFSMNSDVDSMDILGGYEQADYARSFSKHSSSITEILLKLIAVNVQLSSDESFSVIQISTKIIKTLQDSCLSINNIKFVLSDLETLNQIIQNSQLSQIIEELSALSDAISSGEISINFEWFDGLLVEAVEKGYWLILDNANLCSPSVLDRLNSLLEINGSLVINECTNDDGSPRVIQTHPDFRLFLTSDPKYGELSRAMRNRSVEVYVDLLEERATRFDRSVLGLGVTVNNEEASEQTLQMEINGLNINNLEMPLACFTQVNDSTLVMTSLFLDYYTIAIKSENKFAASTILEFIPFSLIPILEKFSYTTSHSSEFSNSAFFIDVERTIKTLEQSGVFDSTEKLYAKAFQKSPLLSNKMSDIKKQPVSVLGNSSLVPLVKEYACFACSTENSLLFAVLFMLSDAFLFMEELQEKAKTATVSSLNKLEQLAAVSLGREVKNLPKINVYKWVVDILMIIRNQTVKLIKTEKFLQVEGFGALFKLVVLWQNFVTASVNYNSTAIRVYHSQLIEWTENASNLHEDAVIELGRTIKFFSDELKLTRGSSMTVIWNSCRDMYPQTSVAWSNYESLLTLASKFDEVAFEQFSENMSNVNEIRKLFIQLFASCLEKTQNDDFVQMLEIIEKQIESLTSITQGFLNRREHPFVGNFNQVLGFVESGKTFSKQTLTLDSETLNLCLLANKPTAEMQRYEKTEIFKPYPNILSSLWDSDGYLKLNLFDDEFLKSTMSMVSQIEYTHGGSIEQTLLDLKFFISQLVKKSFDILADHTKQFSLIIFEWISYIHNIHVELLDEDFRVSASELFKSGSFESLKDYCAMFFKHGHHQYAEIFESFFIPAIGLTQGSCTMSSLGQSYVLAACGFIMLYMPDSTYDPASVDHILYNDFMKMQKLIAQLRESFICARETYFGDQTIVSEKYLPESPKSEINELPRVYRGTESAERLFEEWHMFFSSYIDRKHIDFLLETAKQVNEKADAQINNFLNNASHFVLRLKESHLRFSDLNDILIGFIYSLKLGLQLMHQSSVNKTIDGPSSLWTSDASLIFSPLCLGDVLSPIQKLFKKTSVNDYNVENVYSYMLLLSKVYNSKISTQSGDDPFNKIVMALYYRWSLRTLKEQEKESTESGVYKFADPTIDAEADFKRLFPDSEELMDIDSANSGVSSSQDLSSVYFNIAKAYISNFKEGSTSSLSEISEFSIVAFNSFNKIYERTGSGVNRSSNLVFILSLLKDSYNKFVETKASTDIDFYNGYDFAQTRNAGKLVRNVQISVSELLKKWPEHATLSELFRICGEFLDYPASTPIFRLLAKVEQIFTFIAEWEKYAHSGVSLAVHYKTISGLIVSWRKLELASWKQVFANEEKNIEKNIGKWWFHLFESIIVPSMNNEIFDEEIEIKTISAINVFVSQGSFGDFKYRLDLLSAFAAHVNQLVPSSTVNESLNNIVNYYKQFVPQIEESVASLKKELEKKVNEIILLASWKDVNIDALKQSSRRSHHKLYSVIRKYRDCLVRPVKPLIETGIPFSRKTVVQKPEQEKVFVRVPEDISRIIELCSTISKWNERIPRLRNITQVERNMDIYVKDVGHFELRSLHQYAKDIYEDAERLRKETPSVYTKDNKKKIASLKNEKHKLMSDTIKQLKHMGLKINMTLEIQKALPSVTAILATSKSFDNTCFQNCDNFFFRILDLLPRLRVAVSEVHDDIPPADAHKCLAASEHLLYTLISNRNTYVKFNTLSSKFVDMVANIEQFTTKSKNMLLSASQLSLFASTKDSVSAFVQQAPAVIDFAIESLRNSSQFSAKGYDYSLFTKARDFIVKCDISKNELFGSFESHQFSEIMTFYRRFVDDLDSWKHSNSEVAFVADFVLTWMEKQKYQFETVSEFKEECHTMEDLESAFRDLFNSILVSVQRMHKFHFENINLKENGENMVDDEDEDDDTNWLIMDNKKLKKSVDLLYLPSITNKLAQCISALKSIEYNDQEHLVAAALIEHSLPIVQHYSNLVHVIEHKLKTNYVDLSRGCFELSSILYNVCSKGFCQPELPNEEKEDNNLKEGTGLGDGEGAENNSNDVEEDEDLSEQAQQPNEEKDRDDNESDEDDDAVDIKGDMAGELENVSDQEDKDDEENEENEDQEDELDEEIDDLDESDPNAVDDKMWDEEASPSSKEKDSEEMPDNAEANNDMEAMEDNSEDEKEQKKEDDKQENADNDGEEEKENDDNAEDEEDVGEQEDEVKNEENEQFDNAAPEADALELPEDINLDSDGENNSDGEDENDDKFDDNIDEQDSELKDDDDQIDEKADVEMDNEEPAGDEDEQEVEGAPTEEGDDGSEQEDEDEKDGMEIDNEETNEDAGVDQSDDELKEGEEEDSKEEADKDNSKQEEIEGLEGDESGANNVDDESAVKQQSGTNTEGADADDNTEKENIGASNGGADFQNEEKEDKEDEENINEQNEASRDQAAESMKQLGDSLKEFHRRRQEIKETTDDDMVDQKAGERPDDFQHLDGDNAENETQALGAASKEQVQSIDDNMAIDDDEDDSFENRNDETKTEEDSNNQKADEESDVEMEEGGANEDDFVGERRSGFMNERRRDDNEVPANLNLDTIMDSDDELEDEYHNDNNVAVKQSADLRDYEEANELWKKADENTRDLTSSLCEQLRLILEPTLSTKLRGDYKTGKRLNMKRIIPYIASQFRKDKIWMRRTKPSKRQYQIMISLDNSKSMSESHAVDIAFESVALVSKALSQLESGQLSIMKFGSDSEVVHPFEKQFGGNSGVKAFREFKFDDTKTDIKKLVSKSLKVFNEARAFGDSDLWQLEIILSDGVCEDHETIQRLVRRAREEKVMIVFVIIDGLNSQESILDMSQATYTTGENGKMKLQVNKYLDTFPFEFYVVVHHINELPEMLSLILRQYFTELVSV